ncbi:MAG: prealbumin-like fold domain-containing protein [Hamadaea sp.]|uniref:MSCRAMM family protein n=1 Tax=Hamadaea sp. TaxID=2024425 RepID=UPI0017D6F40E|nr:SpaA isopeptide-forming pilin-related protein [Hamadaea sp.]NUR72380.1 prealbumin-like fold domain-containing protein [Hamadaea sp.]NUT24022.1 prealbumin-like fold domain-containing protein [Hamadaea sp.]
MRIAIASAAAIFAAFTFTSQAYAHPDVSLAGSNFEIDTDANLKVDHSAPSLDWANVTEIRKQDTASGSGDESFGQGTKEDTAVPTVVSGSIPPNKSDLKYFGIYQEGTTTTGFLNLYWARVQDPSGTTNMDFEFNQSKTKSANGVTPVRQPGDLLITYDLDKGGTQPTLSLRSWSGTAWSAPMNLTASNLATGSINSSAIPAAQADGLGGLDPRTFGEAQIALAGIFSPTVCESFGSAYLKSRSSSAFPAEVKDFVPPQTVNITNCGTVKIHKVDDAGTPLSGAEFTLYSDVAPTGGTRDNGDTATAFKCTTDAAGDCTISNVPSGEYWVVETIVPSGHDPAIDQHITITPGGSVTLDPVTNPRKRGAILVTKTEKHAAAPTGSQPQSGVSFTVNGVTKATDATGQACFDGLLFGSYTVHETVPANYVGEPDKMVTVDNAASCADTVYAGEGVSFVNKPLTTITVSSTSQVPGGTAAKISCSGLTPDPADGTPNAFDDTSEAYKDLAPGTYSCTVVIDP